MSVREQHANRAFGRALFSLGCGLTIVPWLLGRPPNFTFLVLGLIALAVAFVRPQLLGPIRRGVKWTAARIQAVISPVILALIFFVVFTPGALLLRGLAKVQFLTLRPDRSAASYWSERRPDARTPRSMKDQF